MGCEEITLLTLGVQGKWDLSRASARARGLDFRDPRPLHKIPLIVGMSLDHNPHCSSSRVPSCVLRNKKGISVTINYCGFIRHPSHPPPLRGYFLVRLGLVVVLKWLLLLPAFLPFLL